MARQRVLTLSRELGSKILGFCVLYILNGESVRSASARVSPDPEKSACGLGSLSITSRSIPAMTCEGIS